MILKLSRKNGKWHEICLLRIDTSQEVKILTTETCNQLPIRLDNGGAERLPVWNEESKWELTQVPPDGGFVFQSFARHEPDTLTRFVEGDSVWEAVARKTIDFWAKRRAM